MIFVFVSEAKIPVLWYFLFQCVLLFSILCESLEAVSTVIMMKLAVVLVIALSIAVESKVYLSCELAKELSKNDMERHLIPHWICLVQAESQGNTTKTVEQPNLTTNYGIFQVKSFHKCFIIFLWFHACAFMLSDAD